MAQNFYQTANQRPILVTGSAGFIGYHLCTQLISRGYEVVGMDRTRNSPDPLFNLRHSMLLASPKYKFMQIDLSTTEELPNLIPQIAPAAIFHLAGTSNVGASLSNPRQCFRNNQRSLMVLLEAVRLNPGIDPLIILASSAAVYGLDLRLPFREDQVLDAQNSAYAVTKRSCELTLKMYNLTHSVRGLTFRFFSLYGPWSQREMAVFHFVDSIVKGEEINLFANGRTGRDLTYIDDAISGCLQLYSEKHRCRDKGYDVFNVATGQCINNLELISRLESMLGKKAKIRFSEESKGSMPFTCADVSKAQAYCNYSPTISLDEGLTRFINWYFSWQSLGAKTLGSVKESWGSRIDGQSL